MNNYSRGIKRTLFITIATVVVLMIMIVVFLSPIAKYLIEKYDVEYTGREIKMDHVYVNALTGHVYFKNLKIYEPKSDSILLSSKGLTLNFSMRKLFSSTYEIKKMIFDEPKGIIIQTKKTFNFDDIIKLFSPKKTNVKKEPLRFSILRIEINNGEFYFIEKEMPVNYFIKKVDLISSGYQWNTDTIRIETTFKAGRAGSDVKGNISINHKTLDYRFDLLTKKFDLEIIDQYLKSLVNYGTFRANIDADIKAHGNFKDQEDVSTVGVVSVNDLHFGKDSLEDYVSFDKLVLGMREVYPKDRVFIFDSIWLTHPSFKYERYDHLDNLENMFGKNASNITEAKAHPEKFNLVIELLRYSDIITEKFFISPYRINKLGVFNGDIKLNDYSLNEKFSASAAPLFIRADSVYKTNETIHIHLKTALQPYGYAAINLNIHPNSKMNFDLNYNIQKVPAALFNPYLISFTSFPMERGTVEVKGQWNVKDGFINSTNHVLIVDPRLGERTRNKGAKWIPMRLIMALIKPRTNVIDYDIPISGSLKKPNFHWGDVIFDLIKNIHVKPVTLPYAIEVSTAENEIERSLTVEWKMMDHTLAGSQENYLKKITRFLKQNPEAKLSVYPITYSEKEKEQILFFEAKKKYFLMNHKKKELSQADSLSVDRSSIKDASFIRFLDKRHVDHILFTVQDKCKAFVDPKLVSVKFNVLLRKRENEFRSYFTESGTEDQIKIHPNKSGIPYNGSSYYKIRYEGSIPPSLISAFNLLDEINHELPRKKYLLKRKQLAKVNK